ncbi:hypothetical protein MAR_018897 [Mya arenaria]|uniref:Uncharacterized protein n=1 Tax=Mya arenaria TaxID=6604 RepID=A0ABY7EIH0_MYAAR|nr:hypothetical protein MAR_018897 [Mya arenaria]
MKTLLNNSLFLSTYCDGSTDNSTSEKEVIMVSVLDDFQPKVCYIKLVEPPNTKADGTVAAIDAAFDEFEMPDYKNKTIGSAERIKEAGETPDIMHYIITLKHLWFMRDVIFCMYPEISTLEQVAYIVIPTLE